MRLTNPSYFLIPALCLPAACQDAAYNQPALSAAEQPIAIRSVAPMLPDMPPGPHRAAEPTELAEREALAKSRRFLDTASVQSAYPLTTAEIRQALDIPEPLLLHTEVSGFSAAMAVLPSLGVIRPTRGGSFLMMSTGAIGSAAPEPGIDFVPEGRDGDTSLVKLQLQVPAGANRLSFNFSFLSAESPEFIGRGYNDLFRIHVATGTTQTRRLLASVDSSFFFDASDTRAKNSGFDIYTDAPYGVDNTFSTGLPDAGLTDFQQVSINLDGAEQVTLTFEIRDMGDGILDSAVLIDNLQLSSIDIVDPNPEMLAEDGSVRSAPDVLASPKAPSVSAVVADGVSLTVLRVKVPEHGNVEFSLMGATPVDGGLLIPGQSELATTVMVPTQATTSGEMYAFAVYRAPADFSAGSYDEVRERSVRVRAAVSLESGTTYASEQEIRVIRPPIVLVHGIWQQDEDWRESRLIADSRFQITYAGYEYMCDEELRVKVPPTGVLSCPLEHATPAQGGTLLCATAGRDAPAAAIREALANMRRLGIAATQVDVIAHGMGGILARQYMDAPGYRNITNRYQGNINRFITLNTPHLGTPVANAAVAARSNPDGDADAFLCNVRVKGQGPLEASDIDMLAEGRTTIMSLKDVTVPSHAIVGADGKTVPRNTIFEFLGALMRVYRATEEHHPSTIPPADRFWIFPNLLTAESDAFGSADHDFFVSVASQQGGIAASAITQLSANATEKRSTHFAAMASEEYAARIVELLNSPIASPLFAEFPAPASVISSGMAPLRPAADATSGTVTALQNSTPGSLQIIAPASGSQVISGSTIQVQLAISGSFMPESILLMATDSDSIAIPASNAGIADYVIASAALGPIVLTAVALAADGTALFSNEVVLSAEPNAVIESMRILQKDPVLFGVGKTRRLAVFANFTDDVERDVTAPVTGTVYASSQPGVATVSADGLITATGPGIATIIARNGNVQDSITVAVHGNRPPIGRFTYALSASCAAAGQALDVLVDASASFDSDGDGLTYSWQVDGAQTATGLTSTFSLGVGAHTVRLVVSDGRLASQAYEVRVDVVDCQALCMHPSDRVWDYCTAECPCSDGEGDCDSNAECAAGLRCLDNVGAHYGYERADVDVCVAGCPAIGSGGWNYCTPECPCSDGEGDCDNRAECEPGLVCAHDVGSEYGLDPEVDVCRLST